MWHCTPEAVVINTMAVSTSPSAAISGVMRTLPAAVMATGSSPSTKRARSKSWIIMSRNSPPETFT